MGRRKIEIQKIDDRRQRSVTFSRRRNGLVKKAHELSVLCECEVALLVVDKSKRFHMFCSSDLDSIISYYKDENIQKLNVKVPSGEILGDDDDVDESSLVTDMDVSPVPDASFADGSNTRVKREETRRSSTGQELKITRKCHSKVMVEKIRPQKRKSSGATELASSFLNLNTELHSSKSSNPSAKNSTNHTASTVPPSTGPLAPNTTTTVTTMAVPHTDISPPRSANHVRSFKLEDGPKVTTETELNNKFLQIGAWFDHIQKNIKTDDDCEVPFDFNNPDIGHWSDSAKTYPTLNFNNLLNC
eukprot:Nk52_evm24s217 gene=Nk52_evmTU24s217